MFADIPSLKQKILKGILSLQTHIFSCLDLNVSFLSLLQWLGKSSFSLEL